MRKAKKLNHKVKEIKLNDIRDVYDLTVDKYHNFALSAGIFVHNSEKDIWNYYEGVGRKMLSEIKDRNIFIGIVPKGYKSGKPIYIRHPYDKKGDYISINDQKDFEVYHSGRTVEYHITMPQMAPYYIIDIDAPGEFANTKKITAEVADALGKLPEVKEIEIRYSGKRGFHVLGWLKKARDVDDARETLHEWLKTTFVDRGDVVLGESPQGDKPALGLSPMKVNGGQSALWSLRVSGLCCIQVPRAQLLSFEREDASMEKTYKKLTGKTFPAGKKEASCEHGTNEDLSVTEVKSLPGSPIEKPVAKAVQALMAENPVSSGWHSHFSPKFNGLHPSWAIVFDGGLSGKARKAAKAARLDINIRGRMVDVYAADVPRDDLEQATKLFNKFAEEYKALSRKASAILSRFYNGETVMVPRINGRKFQEYMGSK